MFENIKKCLDEYEKADELYFIDFAPEQLDILNFFEMNFAKAIMKDLHLNNRDESVAKIILAAKGLSNEIKVKVE